MNMALTLTNAQRAVVRAAIVKAPGWNDWRKARGVTSQDMTSALCKDACSDLGLDLAEILNATPVQEPLPMTAHTPAPVPADEAQALNALRTLLGGAVDEGKVRAIVDAALAPVMEALGKPALLVVDREGQAWGKMLPPSRHPLLETLLRCASARDAQGNRLNTWIAGPAGSGKTHAARQVAEALGLPYGFHGAMTMPHELVGFVDAGGTYRPTVFVTLFQTGGVCLLDEVDAGSNEALLALNAALSNGTISLPSGDLVQRHPDFVCIAAANTWGAGATADYIGRAKLDAAFLDRFGFKLAWDYDLKFERAISGNEDAARVVQSARDAAKRLGLKVVITPRASTAYATALAAGFTASEAADLTYLAGLTDDQRAMLRKEVSK
jgi:cobaltochelatase CobS